MQPVSSRWWKELASGVVIPYRYGLIFDGVGGSQIAGPLFVTDGYVTMDQTNIIRRTCSRVKMTDPTGTLTPSDPSQPLFPEGTELQIMHGLLYPDLTTEVKSLGVFLIEETDSDAGVSPGSTEIWISGSDHGARIARAKFTQPYATDGTSTLDVAIKALIESVLPGMFTYNFIPTTVVPAIATFNVGDDPWASACKLAADSGGYELFPDGFGTLVLRPIVDPLTLPVINPPVGGYVEGPGCQVTELRHTLANGSVPNWVIVISQGSGIAVPLRGDWQDTDPRSYTYIGTLTAGPGSPPVPGSAPYPLTVQKIDTALATTQGAVNAVANAIGLAGKGSFDGVVMWAVGNAAVEQNDVLTLTRQSAGVVGQIGRAHV